MQRNLKKLFRLYSNEINRALRRRGHCPDTAADLTQDVFLRVMNKGAMPKICNPRAYLHRIARNLSIDLYRRERVIGDMVRPANTIEAIADPATGRDGEAFDRLVLWSVEKALLELPENVRRAFELYQIEGLTISQCAETLGLSVSHTWTLIHRAYQHVRDRLDDRGQSDL